MQTETSDRVNDRTGIEPGVPLPSPSPVIIARLVLKDWPHVTYATPRRGRQDCRALIDFTVYEPRSDPVAKGRLLQLSEQLTGAAID